MNEQLLVYLAGVTLLIVLFVGVKWATRGRVVLSFRTAEGILVAAVALACLAAAYFAGQFQ